MSWTLRPTLRRGPTTPSWVFVCLRLVLPAPLGGCIYWDRSFGVAKCAALVTAATPDSWQPCFGCFYVVGDKTIQSVVSGVVTSHHAEQHRSDTEHKSGFSHTRRDAVFLLWFPHRASDRVCPPYVALINNYWQCRGSAIAKIVGANAAQNSKFDSTVKMWVFEETVNGRKLTEIINSDHENVKYLPGHKLPANVVRRCPLTWPLTAVTCVMSRQWPLPLQCRSNDYLRQASLLSAPPPSLSL